MSIRPPNATGIAAGIVLALFFGAGAATAAQLITGADIKDGTVSTKDLKNNNVSTKDIKDGTVSSNDLKNGGVTSTDIKNGTVATGDLSAAAQQNLKTTYAGPEWSIVDRNVIGNGDSYLRSGPSVAGQVPPLGIGSLGIRTGSSADAAAFGNQQDFLGMPVSDLTQVGYWVYTTLENNSQAPNNMPGIKIEINPNLEPPLNAVAFTTMVYQPSNGNAGQWTPFDAVADTAPHWGLTGAALNGTVCSINGPQCTFQDLMTFLNDGGVAASILTVQVGKGRDFPFSGAVDALVINNNTYDFEPFGTFTTPTTPTTLRKR